jgi:hypothetical protein
MIKGYFLPSPEASRAKLRPHSCVAKQRISAPPAALSYKELRLNSIAAALY